ncbi:MAG: DUF507 family protein [Thermodesulfobacteriota bacterium]
MKLRKEQVEKVSSLIIDNLKKKGLIIFKADEGVVLDRTIAIFLDNLRAEDELDREVERMLEAHSGELANGDVNNRKLFRMIKTKLARERDLIL